MRFPSQLQSFLPSLQTAVLRFPIPVMAAIGLCIYVNVGVIKGPAVWFSTAGAIAAFLAGGAAHLFAEAKRWGRSQNLALAATVGAAAFALEHFHLTFHTSELFLLSGLTLVLLIAAFPKLDDTQGAIWLFNLRLVTAAVLAVIVGLVFTAGVMAIITSMDYLFQMKFGQDAFQHVFVTALTLIGPLYGLSLVPRNFADEITWSDHQDWLIERGASVLVNSVLVPLAVIYALILHAYAVKILLAHKLPDGRLGLMVSLFAMGGTTTWLVAWPWRERGSQLLKFFLRFWFWALPIPIALLVVGVSRRIGDYGVTPDRYAIALVAVWAALLFAYLALRKNFADMRMILGAAAALLLLGSFGPFGAYQWTGASQFARLQSVLIEKGVLNAGKISIALPLLAETDKAEARSILQTLRTVGGLGPAIDLLPDPAAFRAKHQDSLGWDSEGNLENQLGVGYIAYAPVNQNKTQDRLAADTVGPQAVSFIAFGIMDQTFTSNTRILGPFATSYIALSEPHPRVAVVYGNDKIEFTIGQKTISIPIDDLSKKLRDAATQGASAPLIVDLDAKTQIAILNAHISAGTNARVDELRFWMMVKE